MPESKNVEAKSGSPRDRGEWATQQEINIGGTSASLRKVRVDRLHYQRDTVDYPQIKRMAANFNRTAFGALTAGERQDHSLNLVDGQRRAEAAKIAGETVVPCLVFASRGHRHEAEIYDLMNGCRRNLTAEAKHHARIDYFSEPDISIHRFLESIGLRVGPTHGTAPNRVGFISELVRTWKKDEEACKKALIAQMTVCRANGVLCTLIHKGLYYLYHKSVDLDKDDLEKLYVAGGQPVLLNSIQAALAEARLTTGSKPDASYCARGVLNVINRGKRSGRKLLPR